MNSAAKELHSQIESSNGQGAKLTISLAGEAVQIVERWRARGASAKETVEQLLRVADEEMRKVRSAPAGQQSSSADDGRLSKT